MDPNQLPLEVDGVTRTFSEWTSDFVDTYYPEVGKKCYCVPALHFNQQLLGCSTSPSASAEAQTVLNKPDPSLAVGDLAHTIVAERLEELSHHLQATGEGPLFIISAFNYDNYLAKLDSFRPKAKRRRSRAKAGLKDCSQDAEEKEAHQETQPKGSDPVPDIVADQTAIRTAGDDTKEDAGVKGDQGQQLLPPRPSDRGGQRGEIDVLLLHRKGGVVLVEVKATGHGSSSWAPSEAKLQSAIQGRVQKAGKQLNSAQNTLNYIMPDLHLPKVTLVLALPYVTRQTLAQATSDMSLDPNLRFLCKDDLLPIVSEANPASRPQVEHVKVGSCAHGVDTPDLLAWWQNTVCQDVSEDLTVESMRTIVGRICGLMSVVSVWTTSKPRMEVRTLSQAIGESARRLADIVLLPRQVALLAQPSLHRLWLTGPMGSGKTLMLQLKGRQWLQEGRRVIVINVRTASRGRPQGHVLEEGIRREVGSHCGTGSVERHDIALDEFYFESLQEQLNARGPTDNACFVVDEVLCEMSVIAQKLADHYPHNPIWCVASYIAPAPSTFQCFRLDTILRNPPSIQLMLKEIDLNTRHRSAYTTRSAARGLPCDGPPIIFIDHSKHNTHVRHLDCHQCADELADLLEHKLGLKLHPPTPEQDDHSSTEHMQECPKSTFFQTDPRKATSTVEAAALSFRDVLVLVALPLTAFRHIRDFHWEASIPDVVQYILYMGTSHFISGLTRRGVPLKFSIDNTLKEIAFPPGDEVIFTDILGAHSLERKVVVLMRSGPPLSKEEVTEHFFRYQTIQTACSGGEQTEMSNLQELLKTPMDKTTIRKHLQVFVSLLYEVRDLIYPKMNLSPSPSLEEAKAIFHNLLGNMLVAGTQSLIKPKTREDVPLTPKSQLSPQHCSESRRGKEYRCDSSTLPGPSQNLTEGAGVSSNADVDEADSVFFVPDLQEDMEQRQGEAQRIQRAMASLSEDDLDWEFFAASRCLSQYITFLW